MSLRPVFCRHWASQDANGFASQHMTWLESRDRKTLSAALLAGLNCAYRILDAAKLSESQREKCGLYVATGLSFDAVSEEIDQVLYTLQQKGSGNEGAHQLERDLPPLTGLKVLANAGAFYIAKYTGLRGDGATFGTTSHAGAMALQAGWYSVASGLCDYSLVGAYDTDGDLIRAARASLMGLAPEAISPQSAAAFLLLQAQQQEGACALSSLDVRGNASLMSLPQPQPPLTQCAALKTEKNPILEGDKFGNSDWGAAQVLMQACATLTDLVHAPRGSLVRHADLDPYGRSAQVSWKAPDA